MEPYLWHRALLSPLAWRLGAGTPYCRPHPRWLAALPQQIDPRTHSKREFPFRPTETPEDAWSLSAGLSKTQDSLLQTKTHKTFCNFIGPTPASALSPGHHGVFPQPMHPSPMNPLHTTDHLTTHCCFTRPLQGGKPAPQLGFHPHLTEWYSVPGLSSVWQPSIRLRSGMGHLRPCKGG